METKVLEIAKIGDPVLRSKTKLIPLKKIKLPRHTIYMVQKPDWLQAPHH